MVKGKDDVLSLSLSLGLSWIARYNSSLLFSSLLALSNKATTTTKKKWLEREREMLDNFQPAEPATVVKRYAPPNQRNRSNNRRKSSDRLDRTNSVGSDLEKNQVTSRNIHVQVHGDAGSSNFLNENHYSRFIVLEGCSSSAASQLLNDRWTAAMQSYNNPKDSSEKPVMYSGGTSAWTQFRLPHQIMSPAASASPSVSQLDFVGELRHQMHSANLSFST